MSELTLRCQCSEVMGHAFHFPGRGPWLLDLGFAKQLGRTSAIGGGEYGVTGPLSKTYFMAYKLQM